MDSFSEAAYREIRRTSRANDATSSDWRIASLVEPSEGAWGRPLPTIRPARSEDAGFIARNILSAQRGPLPRGWFDIALDWPEPHCLAFVERVVTAPTKSWWHVSQFVIAEIEGQPAAALCALPAVGTRGAARSAIEEAAYQTGLNASELAAIFRRGDWLSARWQRAPARLSQRPSAATRSTFRSRRPWRRSLKAVKSVNPSMAVA